MTIVAAFDFDGTLSIRDCVVPFLERVAGRTRLALGIAARPGAVLGAAARRDRDRFKAIAVGAAFGGREERHVERLGAEFADTVHDTWLRPDTTRRLGWHRREGHRVVLVSASLGPYLRPLGQRLGADAVLCTEVVVGADGRYTGALDGGNCRGAAKVDRLRGWLGDNGLDDAELWAYGDSAGDRELLAFAAHGMLVKDVAVSEIPEGS